VTTLPPRHWCDANDVFAELSGFRDFRRPDNVDGAVSAEEDRRTYPVLMELAEAGLVSRLRCDGVAVPAAYPDDTCYCTAVLTFQQLCTLRRDGFCGKVQRWELQLPVIPDRPAPACPMRTKGSMGSDHAGTLIKRSNASAIAAVIDTGCPFAAQIVRRKNGKGTRVWHLWDQDTCPSLRPLGAQAPQGFGFGAHASQEQLDAWMKCFSEGGSIDEDRCYRHADYTVLTPRFGHGAAILDLLASPYPLASRYSSEVSGLQRPPTWKRATDAVMDADIVFVQLPRDVVQDTTSAALPRHLLDGLRYIVCCAGPNTKHIVVNISDGTSRCLHDGTSILEKAMLALVEEFKRVTKGRGRLRIVVAAGNAALEARHAVLHPMEPQKGEDADAFLRQAAWLRVPPGCEVPTFLNVRLPGGISGLRLCVKPPGTHTDVLAVSAGHYATWPPYGSPSCWVIVPPAWRGLATYALVVWSATLTTRTMRARARAGDWRISVVGETAMGEHAPPVDLWISRNGHNDGTLKRAIPSRFVDADGRYDPRRHLRPLEDDPEPPRSVIRRRQTLNGLATMAADSGIDVVGGRIRRAPECEDKRAPYSSMGPAVTSGRNVDGLRDTDFARTLPAIRATGNRSGDHVRVAGTSFAAPQWARELLELGCG
jgi:hypothetical protein